MTLPTAYAETLPGGAMRAATKVGIAVRCVTCGMTKAPRRRSVPFGSFLCESACTGFNEDPQPGDLWPGETDADFGYPCSDNATRPTEANAVPAIQEEKDAQ